MRAIHKLLSRGAALIGGVSAALGIAIRPALGQQDGGERVPEDETRWARMGVSLEGQTALVTGSTDGLGTEVARQLGALGAFVIVHGRNR